jgi:hypothetical protein
MFPLFEESIALEIISMFPYLLQVTYLRPLIYILAMFDFGFAFNKSGTHADEISF